MQYISVDNYPSSMLNNEDWGGCRLHLEIGNDGYPMRQIEFHKNGKTLKYTKNGIFQDEFSVLIDSHFQANDGYDFDKYKYKILDQSEFDTLWNETVFDNTDNWKWKD